MFCSRSYPSNLFFEETLFDASWHLDGEMKIEE